MHKDELERRMKENYEMRSRTYLIRRMPVIIRLDGCHFHTFCKGFDKPFDKIFAQAMQETTRYLCQKIQGCKLGYTQSDEISLLVTDYDNLNTDAWFDNQVQKIVSVSASMATFAFNRFFTKIATNWINEQCNDINRFKQPKELFIKINRLIGTYERRIEEGAIFDARCYNIPKEEVANYFIWRQQDAIRNSKASLAQSLYSQKRLDKLSADEMIKLVADEHKIYWGDFIGEQKWGSTVVKIESSTNPDRKSWWINQDPTPFIECRDYIEELIK